MNNQPLNTKLTVVLSLLFLVTLGKTSHAVLIIDDFQSPAIPAGFSGTLLGVPSPQNFTHTGPTTSIIGGERELTYTSLGGTFFMGDGGAVGQNIPPTLKDGMLFVSGPSSSSARLFYNGIGTPVGGLGGINLLSQGPGFQLDFDYLNTGDSVDTQVNITVDANGNTKTYIGQIPDSSTSPITFLANFSSFSGPGPLSDFQFVRSIDIRLNVPGEANTDFLLTGVSVQALPEPTSIFAWALGLAAVAVFACRRSIFRRLI